LNVVLWRLIGGRDSLSCDDDGGWTGERVLQSADAKVQEGSADMGEHQRQPEL
jgi:hypothetical protein